MPILIMWFGIGEVPAILTAFLISFFPIVVNVATGLATMEPELEDVLRALGARKLDIMLKVGIPRTQPYLFGSLKVAITLAFVGTVVSETIGANAGLGYPDRAGRLELPDAAGVRRRCCCSRSRASRCMRCSPMSRAISRAGRSAPR